MENKLEGQENAPIQKLGELIKGIRYAMLTTQEPNGELRSRPMATEEIGPDGSLWFFTNDQSGKVREIRDHFQVNVSYSEPENDRFVSVSGHAEVDKDVAKAKDLWKPLYRAWFPRGLEDPHVVLLKVVPTEAEYWDPKGGQMVHLFQLAKAVLTGKQADRAEVHHHRMTLNR